MTTSRPRTLLGVVLGVALATIAAWLATQLLRGNPSSPAAQPPPPASARATSPTETTASPAFTREGAIEGLRLIVRKRLEAFNTLDEAILRSIYTADCRLANGNACLKGDLETLRDLQRKNQRLHGYPNIITEIKLLSWEPMTRTAVMRVEYEARPAEIINAAGEVVSTEKRTAKRVVDQVNLAWDGSRWRQAFAGRVTSS
jgi:nuclear transport factor 2 (NTF2) superfamily protein